MRWLWSRLAPPKWVVVGSPIEGGCVDYWIEPERDELTAWSAARLLNFFYGWTWDFTVVHRKHLAGWLKRRDIDVVSRGSDFFAS